MEPRLRAGQAADSGGTPFAALTSAPPTISFVPRERNSYLAGPSPYPCPGVDTPARVCRLPGIYASSGDKEASCFFDCLMSSVNCFRTQPKEFIAICVPWHSVAVGRLPLRGVSTPGHGQGEGPVDSKLSRSDDADGDGRGRSERSERSPLRGNLPTAAKHGAQKRILTFRKVFDIFVIYNKPRANNN